jgi:protease-4
MEKAKKTKSKKNYLAWTLGCIGIFLLIFSLTLNLILGTLFITESISKPSFFAFNEVCFDNCESKNKIAVIDINGTVLFRENDVNIFAPGRITAEDIAQQIKQAAEDMNVKAIILNINSPGGSITASDFLYNEILSAKEAGKKIVTHFKDVGASGAYYISAPSNSIIASPTALTGSIGVIIETINIGGLFEKIGLKDIVFKSGEHKDLLSYTREPTDEEKEILQNIVDESQARFLEIITKNRGIPSKNLEIISDGRVLTAKQAKELNLIDELGYLNSAVNKAKELADIKEAALTQYKQPFSWEQLFGGLGVKLKGESIISELKNSLYSSQPRIMYLWK